MHTESILFYVIITYYLLSNITYNLYVCNTKNESETTENKLQFKPSYKNILLYHSISYKTTDINSKTNINNKEGWNKKSI